jgi:hypothetical protein
MVHPLVITLLDIAVVVVITTAGFLFVITNLVVVATSFINVEVGAGVTSILVAVASVIIIEVGGSENRFLTKRWESNEVERPPLSGKLDLGSTFVSNCGGERTFLYSQFFFALYRARISVRMSVVGTKAQQPVSYERCQSVRTRSDM